MTARKKYVRTIDAAFESLTLDGKRLDYVQAYAHFDKLSQKRKPDEGWKRDLFWLVFHLTIDHGKSIAALTSGTTGPPKRITIPRRDLVGSFVATNERTFVSGFCSTWGHPCVIKSIGSLAAG